METSIILTYYLIMVSILSFYMCFRKKGSLRISDFIVIVTTLVINMAGCYNSYGIEYGYGQFNMNIFMDYCIFMSAVPVGLMIGNRLSIKNNFFSYSDKPVDNNKLKVIIVFMLIYSAFYFYFIRNSIPLVLLLTGKTSDRGLLAQVRMSISHDFDEYFNIPFVLRYYRIVLQDLSRFILSIYFLMFLQNKRKYKKAFISLLVITIFYHTYNFEKSGLVYVIMVLFIDYVLIKKISIKGNLTFYLKGLLAIVAGLIGMYVMFMGAKNFSTAMHNMFVRGVVKQSSAIYLQNIMLNDTYGGSLHGSGIPVFLLDAILERNTISLSKQAYAILYSAYSSLGYTGTTGGMPMFYLRSNMGYVLGTMVLLILSISSGILDNILVGKMEKNQNSIVLVSLYSSLLIYFVEAFIGNFSTVYMLPFVFSPQLLVIFFTASFITKKGS